MSNATPEFELVSFEEGEIGEPVEIETPAGTIQATWLGTVDGPEALTRACQLMCELAEERQRQRVKH